jgi:hypothetical protein
MKSFKKISQIFLMLAFVSFLSCEKEQFYTESNSLSDEIEMIESRYKEGDIKIETLWEPGCHKIEKIASLDLKEKIRKQLEESYSKQTTYLKSGGNIVGVIKSGYCGSYKVLSIFMDCEDKRNKSSYSGWTGDSKLDRYGNITLDFCIVDGAYFERTNVDYAVLDFSNAAWPSGVSRIKNWMDNENSGNINSINLDNVSIRGQWNGSTHVDTNTMLGYYYYPKVSNSTPFPSLGISYGVFGNFGTTKGTIFSDNEDSAVSWTTIEDWNGVGLNPPIQYLNGTPGIVVCDHNSNTTMYYSKIN